MFMEQLQIGKNILRLRHEANITQTDLAEFLGVTKASVSKWETSQSFPDITLLPRLAMYFNITVDQLLGYSPQLSNEQILKIYQELSSAFTKDNVNQAIKMCEDYEKQYYNCYPLLIKIASMYMNHLPLLEQEDERKDLIKKIIRLNQRVIHESNQIHLKQEATIHLAHCYIILQQPEEALEVTGDQSSLIIPVESLRAHSYQMLNQLDQAQKTLQIAVYQHALSTIQLLADLMLLPGKSLSYYEEVYQRAIKLCDAFQLDYLHPYTIVKVHINGAFAYSTLQQKEKALHALKEYVRIVTNYLFPLELKGDSFFSMLDEWLKEMMIPNYVLTNESIIHRSIMESLEHPIFSWLSEEPTYIQLKYTLQKFFNSRS